MKLVVSPFRQDRPIGLWPGRSCLGGCVIDRDEFIHRQADKGCMDARNLIKKFNIPRPQSLKRTEDLGDRLEASFDGEKIQTDAERDQEEKGTE